jgi:hypothetical protein
VIQAKVWVNRSRGDIRLGRHMRQEDCQHVVSRSVRSLPSDGMDSRSLALNIR